MCQCVGCFGDYDLPIVLITPAGFDGFFEEIGALSPTQQQQIPRVVQIAARYGMQVLPPMAE